MGREKTAQVNLEIKGRLIINTINEQKQKLLDAYTAADGLVIRLEEVSAIDLSFFQLLCALHRSSIRDKKRVEVKLPVSPLVRAMMAGIGFERTSSCTEEGAETCFWKTITQDKTGSEISPG